MVAISGVQRFIGESRSTADLHASSVLVSELARAMLDAVPRDSDLVLPSSRPDRKGSLPNRVVVLADAGTGNVLAAAMAERAKSAWQDRLADVFGVAKSDHLLTPGFPAVQWAVVSFDPDGYPDAWAKVQALLRARKRIRDFPGYDIPQTGVCSLTGRWAVETVPPNLKRRLVIRSGEALSAVGQVKRWYGQEQDARFPSTWSIATAPFRDAIISLAETDDRLYGAAVDMYTEFGDLSAVPEILQAPLGRGSGALRGLAKLDDEVMRWLRDLEGAWCVPDTWEPAQLRRAHDLKADPDAEFCRRAHAAAAALVRESRIAREQRQEDVPPLTPYLALIAQDADRLGEKVGRFDRVPGDPIDFQRRVAAVLDDIAGRQIDDIELAHLGQVVYAGGDDLLALVPAGRALSAARSVNRLFADDPDLNGVLNRPSASTAVVFFHATWPLQSAVASVHELLKEAKTRARPGLGVAVLNRGGERARVVLPWHDLAGATPMIGHLEDLVAVTSGPLSARLAGSLERDRDALAELSQDWRERELARRARRHGIPGEHAAEVGRVLARLCQSTPGRDGFTDCAHSVVIARFVAGQTRVAA